MKFRGYDIVMTGDGHPANDALIYKNGVHIETCGSKEAALALIEEWTETRR